MDGGNANFQISGGGKYQVRREVVRLIEVEKKRINFRRQINSTYTVPSISVTQ